MAMGAMSLPPVAGGPDLGSSSVKEISAFCGRNRERFRSFSVSICDGPAQKARTFRGRENPMSRIDRLGWTGVAAIGLLCAPAARAQPPVAATTPTSTAPAQMTVNMVGPGAKDLGTAIIIDAPKGVIVRLQLKGLAPGWHGMHFHEKGDCSA